MRLYAILTEKGKFITLVGEKVPLLFPTKELAKDDLYPENGETVVEVEIKRKEKK
jgi:hypothetical protein